MYTYWKRFCIAADQFSRRMSRITEMKWYRYHEVNKLFTPIADQREACLRLPWLALKATDERHVSFRMHSSRNSYEYLDCRFKHLKFYMNRRSLEVLTRRDLQDCDCST